jgi:signal transduction protein with GAF and PtsI domain
MQRNRMTPYDRSMTDAHMPASPIDQAALEAVIAHLAADSGTVHRAGEDGHLHLTAIVGAYPPPVMDAIRRIPVGKGLAGLAAQRLEPVTVCNLQEDPSGQVRPGARATGMEGAITVPCIDANGTLRAVLGIANRAARTFTPDEVRALLERARAIAADGSHAGPVAS